MSKHKHSDRQDSVEGSMGVGFGVIIFFLSLIAVIAEIGLYFLFAYLKVAPIALIAHITINLLIATLACGISYLIASIVATKTRNSKRGYNLFFGMMGSVLVALILIHILRYGVAPVIVEQQRIREQARIAAQKQVMQAQREAARAAQTERDKQDAEELLCHRQMREIYRAALRSRYGEHETAGESVQLAKLAPKYIPLIPECPSGGLYSLAAHGAGPLCSVHGGLPRSTLDDVSDAVAAEGLLREAVSAFEAGARGKAEEYYAQARERQAGLLRDIFSYLGEYYTSTRDYTKAFAVYLQAWLEPDMPSVELAHKTIAAGKRVGRVHETIVMYQYLLQHGFAPAVCDELADIYRVLGEPQKAIDVYRAALASSPQSEALYIGLASLCASLKRYDEGIAALTLAIGKLTHANKGELHNMCGDLYCLKEDFRNARGEYSAALLTNSNSAIYNFNAGRALIGVQYYEKGLHYLNVAESNGKIDAELYYYKGLANYHLRKKKAAQQAVIEALVKTSDPSLLSKLRELQNGIAALE